ncbi:MAG: NUDIX domain-containing protein [Gemmatimonadaceae bacterium]
MSEPGSDAATGDSMGTKPLANAVMTRIVPGVVDVVVLAPTDGLEPSHTPTDRWRVLTLKRGPGTRCTGAWEIVHGRIESGERAEQAAVREVGEETGLVITRLYSITVNSFYLHQTGTVQLALVFAAVVDATGGVHLGVEHDEFAWHSMADAASILAWPREREALGHVAQLLRTGDAGPVEDVLRII